MLPAQVPAMIRSERRAKSVKRLSPCSSACRTSSKDSHMNFMEACRGFQKASRGDIYIGIYKAQHGESNGNAHGT